MTQLHAIHHGINAVRPTNDVDIAIHIETARGIPTATADALESLGYAMKKTSTLTTTSATGSYGEPARLTSSAVILLRRTSSTWLSPTTRSPASRSRCDAGHGQSSRRHAGAATDRKLSALTRQGRGHHSLGAPPLRGIEFEGCGLHGRQPRPRPAPARRRRSIGVPRGSVRRAKYARWLRPQTPGCLGPRTRSKPTTHGC